MERLSIFSTNEFNYDLAPKVFTLGLYFLTALYEEHRFPLDCEKRID